MVGVRERLSNVREMAEERIDRFKMKQAAKSERRSTEYEARAAMTRGGRQVENRERFNRGEISEDLYKKREARIERKYEGERRTPEQKFEQVTERIVTGSAAAVAAFNKDLEENAAPRRRSSRNGGGRSSSGSRSSGSSTGVDFSSLNNVFSSGSSKSKGTIDFSSLNGMFSQKKKR